MIAICNTNMVQMVQKSKYVSSHITHGFLPFNPQKKKFIYIPCFVTTFVVLNIFSTIIYILLVCIQMASYQKKIFLIFLPKLPGKIYCILFLFYYVFVLDIPHFLCSSVLILHKHFFIFFSFIFFLHYVYDLFLIMFCNLQHEKKTSLT
jgi:hypothetical protein